MKGLWGWGRRALRMGAEGPGTAPPALLFVRAPLPPPRPCQEPSFGSLITSASSPHCICNDLFTSLCRLLCQTGLSLRTRAMSCSYLPRFLLPHTAWHSTASGNCVGTSGCGTLICFSEVSRFTTLSKLCEKRLRPPPTPPLSGAWGALLLTDAGTSLKHESAASAVYLPACPASCGSQLSLRAEQRPRPPPCRVLGPPLVTHTPPLPRWVQERPRPSPGQ